MRVLHDPVRAILSIDPIWAAYALADLAEAMQPYCQWRVHGEGLCLLFTALDPPILLTVGNPADVARVLAQAALPPRVFLSVQEAHLPAVRQHYPHIDRHEMLRMALPAQAELPAIGQSTFRLTSADAPRLEALYRCGGPFAPDSFAAYQLADGYFFGALDESGELAAAGGTHIVNTAESVATIGNIYTRPDCRGRGYAKAITAAIVAALQAEGVGIIVLNVNQRNDAARALYRTLGFEEHCVFIEGVAEKRNP